VSELDEGRVRNFVRNWGRERYSRYALLRTTSVPLIHSCYNMSSTVCVGIDIGSQKTMMAKDDADIIRTDTGNATRSDSQLDCS
jgi:hypothetical protein